MGTIDVDCSSARISRGENKELDVSDSHHNVFDSPMVRFAWYPPQPCTLGDRRLASDAMPIGADRRVTAAQSPYFIHVSTHAGSDDETRKGTTGTHSRAGDGGVCGARWSIDEWGRRCAAGRARASRCERVIGSRVGRSVGSRRRRGFVTENGSTRRRRASQEFVRLGGGMLGSATA